MSAQCLVPFTKGARDKIIDLCRFLSSSRDETITLLVLQIKGFVIFFWIFGCLYSYYFSTVCALVLWCYIFEVVFTFYKFCNKYNGTICCSMMCNIIKTDNIKIWSTAQWDWGTCSLMESILFYFVLFGASGVVIIMFVQFLFPLKRHLACNCVCV